MQHLKNGEDKDGIINTLIEISINEDTRVELIEKVLNYNVNDNNPVDSSSISYSCSNPYSSTGSINFNRRKVIG